MISLVDGDLYQWDTGRIVRIINDSDVVVHEVHFTTQNMDFAYVVETYVEDNNVYCAIPNILLQQYMKISCYEVRKNSGGEESISATVLPVIKRNKPEDYVYTEIEKFSYKALENRIEEIESTLETLSTGEEAIVALSEVGLIEPIASNTGAIYINQNGNILTL